MIRLNFFHLIVLSLAIFYPLEEFLEKWLPRGSFYEAVRYGSEIILVLSLIWVFFTRSILPAKWKKTPIDLVFFLFLLVGLISTFSNNLPMNMYLLGLRPLIRYVSVFYIIVQIGYNSKFSQRFVQVCLIVGGGVSIIALLQSFIGSPASNFLLPEDVEIGGVIVRQGARQYLASRTRVFSTLGRYDTLGTYLSILILLTTSMYWSRALRKKHYYIFIVLALPALILSYSRQSWLVTFIGIFILMLLYRKQRLQIKYTLLAVFLLITLATLFNNQIYYSSNEAEVSIVNRILEPLSSRYLQISRYSYGRLFVITEVSRRIISRAPLIGFGPGNFGSLTSRYLGRDFSSLINIRPESAYLINDVNWVTVLGQVGLVGTLLFACIIILMIFHSRYLFRSTDDNLKRGYAGALIAILTGFIIMGFFGPNFEVRQVSFFVWAIAGIVISIRTQQASIQSYPSNTLSYNDTYPTIGNIARDI